MQRLVRAVGSAGLALLLCLLTACTYTDREPGLFGRDTPGPTVAPPSGSTPDRPSTAPPPGNPDLPVAGDAVWTSGDGLEVTVRIAVHAVRRDGRATVLDWSVTPLYSPGLDVGDPVPASFNLGLTRFGEGNNNVFLLDPDAARLYRPLTRRDGGGQPDCLCTSVWFVQQNLQMGRTSLLQTAFPALPPDVTTVDVDVPTVAVFWRVPVTPGGMVPTASGVLDLTRTIGETPPVLVTRPFRYAGTGQSFVIGVESIQLSNSFTSVVWSIQSTSRGGGLENVTGAPFADVPAPSRPYNQVSAGGPRVRTAGGRWLRPRQATTALAGHGELECLCTDLRLWAGTLRDADQAVDVVTNFPPLPNGSFAVDLSFPGVQTFHDVPVVSAPDGAFRTVGPVREAVGTWTYDPRLPRPAWSVAEWPTPLPRPEQVAQFRATVDRLVR